MDLAHQKEEFSRAYAAAVASVAGYSTYKPEVDDDSIDLGLAARGGGGTVKSPRLEVQLKCTSSPVMDSETITFPLKLKNYKDLIGGDYAVPRILVLVIVPDDVSNWLEHTENQLAIKHCGYWVSLKDLPETENRASVSIKMPRKQQFSVAALKELMKTVSEGSTP